jgi:hypothetical protein
MLEERFAALANDYLAASGLPTDASGPPNPMSAVSMRSPPTGRDSAAHHGPYEGRLRLGTLPTLSPIEKPPPVVGLRWVG